MTRYEKGTLTFATAEVYNVLDNGPAFCRRLDTLECGFIPPGVVASSGLAKGETYRVALVPNRNQYEQHRTPWVITYVFPDPIEDSQQFTEVIEGDHQLPDIDDAVVKLLQRGNVWTIDQVLATLPHKGGRAPDSADRSKVGAALWNMFRRGQCARFAMWKASTQDKVAPDMEWFTCYPDKADVAEWEDEE